MKVVAFNGSARKGGNTARLIQRVFVALDKEGIATEMVELGGKALHGCTACFQCFTRKDKRCAVADDNINDHIGKMIEADAIILASPTYFADITPELKALIDRSGMVARANKDMFQRKVGAAIVTRRRGGAIHAFDSINHFFFIGQMVVPGSNYWNVGVGRQIGEVDSDEEGMETMQRLGENMAWLLKKIHA
jgi:multimeric flavodoxin WrbA